MTERAKECLKVIETMRKAPSQLTGDAPVALPVPDRDGNREMRTSKVSPEEGVSMEPGATSTLPCGSEAENGPPSPGDVDELVDTALPTKEGTMLTGKEYLVEHDTLKQLCNLCRSNLLLGVEMLDDWYGVRGVLKIGPPSDKLGLLEASNNLKIKEEESTVGGGGGGGEFSDGARERKTPSMTPSLSPVPEGLPTTLPDSPKHALPPPKVPKRNLKIK